MANYEKLIFDLQLGLHFEDTSRTLLWKTPLQEIKEIDNPSISNAGLILEWKNKLCFGGELFDVIVEQNEFTNCKGILEFIDIKPIGLTPSMIYNKYFSFFKNIFGEPTEHQIDNFDLPTSLWNLKNLQIILGVAERFDEYSIFSIHFGKPYWELNL